MYSSIQSASRGLVALGLTASMVLVGSGSALASDAFTDVPDTHAFHDEINKLVELGIATGNADGTFGANSTITREAIMSFAYKTAGSPAGPFTTTFTDVPTTNAFFDAIAWAQTTGVTEGFADGTFRPTQGLSREAFAAFVFRLAGSPAGVNAESFSDVDSDDTFFDAISWAAANEIVNGYADGTFKPAAKIKRQATAALLVRGVDKGFFGKTLVSNQTFAVTPATEVALDVSSSAVDNTGRRTFTVANPVADAEHQLAVIDAADVTISAAGQVTLEATAGAATLTASSAYIELIDGAAAGQTQATDVTPTDGDAVDVVIDSVTAGDSAVLIVWFDADEDGNLDVDTDGAPTEPFGVSGITNYTFAEAAAGLIGAVTVVGVNLDLNYFDDSTNTFNYSAADTFRFDGGANITLAQFEGLLTSGDEIDGTYDDDGASLFDVTIDVVPAASAVEAETTVEATDDNTLAVSWTASDQVDATYTVSVDDGNAGGFTELADGVTGTSYTATGVADLNPGDAGYIYRVVAVGGVSDEDSTNADSAALLVPAATETLAVLVNGSVVDTNVGSTATATDGDVFVMYFDNEVVLDSASLLIDGVIVEDGVNATFVADGSVLTITLTDDAGTITYGDNGTLAAIAGIESVDGELATYANDAAFEDDGPELLDSTFSASSNSIVLEFNEALIEVTAENVDNYVYDTSGAGADETVVSATLGADGRTVTLVVTTPPAAGVSELDVTVLVLDTEGDAATVATLTATA